MRFTSAPWVTLFALAKPCLAEGETPKPAPSVLLDVSSDLGCASKPLLMERVQARVPSVRFVDEPGGLELGGLELGARFTRLQSGRVAGELVLIDGALETTLRRLEAPSCPDAVDGMALILAITLDPTAGESVAATAPDPAPTGTAAPSKETPGSPGVSSTHGTSTPVDPVDDPLSSNVGARAFPRDVEANGGESRPWRLEGFAAGQVVWGPAPDVMPGLAAYALLAFDRPSAWSRAVALGGTGMWSGSSAEWGGTASFSLIAGTFDACALRSEVLAFEARVCGSALVGRLTATGADAMNETATVHRPFVSLGASALLNFHLGPRLALGARVSPRLNLIRDEFAFRPRVFHRVNALTLGFDLGLGVSLP